MADDALPAGITLDRTADTISATAVVDATPAEVFDFLRRPANHATISGDRSVRDAIKGPEVLKLGDRFGMNMKMGVPYRISSKVEEFVDDERIAWAHLGGHRWRWEVGTDSDGATTVTETFDLGPAKIGPILRLAGFPGRHRSNVVGSVANVRDHFAG